MLKIDIEYLPHGEGLDCPHHATEESAGSDLRAAVLEDLVLQPGERAIVPCGFTMALAPGYEAQIRARSGLTAKHGVTVLNAPGTIDSDYRGEIKVILINLGQEPFTITRGLRIAQMVVASYEKVEWALGDVASKSTERQGGGFGSTGTH